MGRLSLNPLAHLDLAGSLMVLFVGFGWAKPVPINIRSLSKPRRDLALIAVAGPLANILMAIGWAVVARLSFAAMSGAPSGIVLGFWAMSKDEELPNKNLTATFLVKIEDSKKNFFNKSDEEYVKFVKNQNTDNRKSILQSYDQLLNNKYQVKVNQKSVDRVKNYFK